MHILNVFWYHKSLNYCRSDEILENISQSILTFENNTNYPITYAYVKCF